VNQRARTTEQQLLGSWTLIEWSEEKSGGSKAFPLGEDAVGQIIRHYRFEDELLVLDADTDWGRVRIVWRKAKDASSKPR
jgi:hypothetical protein